MNFSRFRPGLFQKKKKLKVNPAIASSILFAADSQRTRASKINTVMDRIGNKLQEEGVNIISIKKDVKKAVTLTLQRNKDASLGELQEKAEVIVRAHMRAKEKIAKGE